jgi:hypothetical protein
MEIAYKGDSKDQRQGKSRWTEETRYIADKGYWTNQGQARPETKDIAV